MPNTDIPMGDKKIAQLVSSTDSETSAALDAKYSTPKAAASKATAMAIVFGG